MNQTLLFVSLEHETARLINDHFGLIRLRTFRQFPVYGDERALSFVCGVEPIAAAAACGYMAALAPPLSVLCCLLRYWLSDPSLLLASSLLLFHTIVAGGRRYHPDMLLQSGIGEAVAVAGMPTAATHRHEASAPGTPTVGISPVIGAICEATGRFFPPHRFQCVGLPSGKIGGGRLDEDLQRVAALLWGIVRLAASEETALPHIGSPCNR